LRIEPDASLEEVAAIMAALAVALEDREKPEELATLRQSRWMLASLLGHEPPQGMRLEGSLWSYSSWEDMA
jgi:hypothetical protein